MTARTKARTRAVEILYEADLRGLPLTEVAAARLEGWDAALTKTAYAHQLIEGVAAHFDEINEWLATYSLGWTVARMPAVDRAILRLGAWEIVYADDIPDPVVIEQAADLAGSLSTDGSADFVSGLLGRLALIKDTLR